MINKRTPSPRVATHFHSRLPRGNSELTEARSLGKMRLQVASCDWLLLLLINTVARGLTTDQKKQDFRRSSASKNLLMDNMMKKYSYPKNEVTAGVGYGHHLHPFYYQGNKEMMYPCAVECGEWETMQKSEDDSSQEGSSNVDMVTVHPDITEIEITTPKPRSYKDTSSLRPKKYESSSFAPKSPRQNDFSYQDSKAADVQIIPQTTSNRYHGESDVESPSDGSLYARYHDALVSGFQAELNPDANRGNAYFDPVEENEESMAYNPPSFNDDEGEDVEASGPHPNKRKKVEEMYVKHNVREEHLEDVRSNSFGPYEEGEDYPTGSGAYTPPKYTDDYAAPIKPHRQRPKNQYHKGKPFRPSPPHGNPFLQGLGHGASNPADYGDYDEPPAKFEGSFSPTKAYDGPPRSNYVKQGQNYPKKFHPGPRGRPSAYSRHRKFPPGGETGGYHNYRTKSQQSSYQRVPYQSITVIPGGSSSGGIRVVPPPRIRAPSQRHGKSPYHNNGMVRSSPYARGQRMIYRRTIPQRDGFTKIVKKYNSFVDYVPKRYT